jgi:hypothetical protein
MRKGTTNPTPDRLVIEAEARVARENLIRELLRRADHAEKARLRAWDDRNDESQRHYTGARNAYLDATWTVANAILPPDELRAFREGWAKAGRPPMLDKKGRVIR